MADQGLPPLHPEALAQHVVESGGRRIQVPARETRCAADVLVLVTSREPQADLYHQLLAAGVHAGSVHTIGDCHHPALIASAVYAGHKIGRELGRAVTAARRDRVLMPPAV